METLKKLSSEQLEMLKRPLPSESIKPHPTKKYLSTIKAIYVVERLNEVFGLGGWVVSNEVIEAGEKQIVVKSCFHAPDYGIVISDIFGGNDNPDRGDAYKGACTDALTKIGSYLYVGMDVFKGLNEDSKQYAAQPQSAAHPNNESKKMQPNEKTKDENDLPWLSEKQFNDAMKRINGGESDIMDKLKLSFRMKREYRESLQQAIGFANQLENQ